MNKRTIEEIVSDILSHDFYSFISKDLGPAPVKIEFDNAFDDNKQIKIISAVFSGVLITKIDSIQASFPVYGENIQKWANEYDLKMEGVYTDEEDHSVRFSFYLPFEYKDFIKNFKADLAMQLIDVLQKRLTTIKEHIKTNPTASIGTKHACVKDWIREDLEMASEKIIGIEKDLLKESERMKAKSPYSYEEYKSKIDAILQKEYGVSLSEIPRSEFSFDHEIGNTPEAIATTLAKMYDLEKETN